MQKLRFVIPGAVLGIAFLFSSTTSFAKPEFTKKEKKPCTTCHVSAKSKDLNDTGKCYQKSNSLANCPTK
jgi:hypothetical protein